MKRVIIAFLFSHVVFAAAPPPSTEAQKAANSDPEVIKDDVDKMKEDVLNKKTQNLLFKQLVRSENIESSFPTVNISHVNEMGVRYKIVSLAYSLDGERIYNYLSEERVGKEQVFNRETQVYKGPMVPGSHELVVDVVYKGNDTGVFSYINDYKIPVQTKRSFKVDKGQKVTIQVVGFEKGWALTDFKDRPDFRFKILGANTAKTVK